MKPFRCWASTDTGCVRSRNEDAYAISSLDPFTVRASWMGELDETYAWAIVADGMGGHPAGDVASKLAVACAGTLLSQGPTETSLRACVESTDDAIRHAMELEPNFSGMGTTIVGMVVRESRITTFNVGDSRAYLFTKRRFWQLSMDHSSDLGLTLCLGGASRERPLEPDIFSHSAVPASRVLLCTDGLTNLVPVREIARLIWDDLDPAGALVKAALAAGGHDNVTAVVSAFK